MELEKEGVNGLEITYTDNKPVLDLYLKRPIGLLSLLDEQCRGFNVCTHIHTYIHNYELTHPVHNSHMTDVRTLNLYNVRVRVPVQ